MLPDSSLALPACCTPDDGATLDQVLYCVYNAGGPAENIGLATNGRPLPSWTRLERDALDGSVGSAATIAKCGAMALHVETMAEQLLDLHSSSAVSVQAVVTREGQLHNPRELGNLVLWGLRETYPLLEPLVSIEPNPTVISRIGVYHGGRIKVGSTIIPVKVYVVTAKGGA